ncbi:MAG: hypothetical protein ACLFN2_07920 [Bacteroidales bacterium]
MNELNYIKPATEHSPQWSDQDSREGQENRRLKLGFYLLRLVIISGLLVSILQVGSTI